MNEEIKRCPFCSSNADIEIKIEFEDKRKIHYFAVVCCYCEAQGPGYGFINGFIKGKEAELEQRAIKAWNKRIC